MRQHGVEHRAFHADAVLRQHGDVVFQVLPDFLDVFVFKQRPQQLQFLLAGLALGGHGQIPRLVRFDGKGKTDQLSGIHVDVGRFGVEDELLLFAQQVNQRLNVGIVFYKLIVMRHRLGRVLVGKLQ